VKTVMMGNELDGLRILRTAHVNESVALLARLTHSLTRVADTLSRNAAAATRGAAGGGSSSNGSDGMDAQVSVTISICPEQCVL
jgi:hypothetical protein